MPVIPHEGFHEVWWIYRLPEFGTVGDLRLAHFRKSANGILIVIITGEVDPKRIGVRIWDHVADVEGWVKVAQVPIPTEAEIKAVL